MSYGWIDPRGVLGSATTTGSTGGPFGNTTGTVTAPGGVITDIDRVSMQQLASEAFNIPVERLIDLWLTRYGNEWMELETIQKDEFFALAYKRLKSLGQLETHYLTDRARFVCRKPE